MNDSYFGDKQQPYHLWCFTDKTVLLYATGVLEDMHIVAMVQSATNLISQVHVIRYQMNDL